MSSGEWKVQKREINIEGRNRKEWSCWRHGTLDGLRTGHSENDIFRWVILWAWKIFLNSQRYMF